MDLAQSIKQYYFGQFSELPAEKQFHFASRIAAWESDEQAVKHLKNLQGFMTNDGDIKGALQDILAAPIGNVYGKKLRKTYFDKYPGLYGIHNAFFRLRHLKEVYGIDCMADFLELVPLHELKSLYDSLGKDIEAFRILSRFAVDYIFLYEILFDIKDRLDPEAILEISKGYDLCDTQQANLYVYLLTHCIIADSNFYIRNIASGRLDTYTKMLDQLDIFIGTRRDIKLDAQFEVLVANRICMRFSSMAGTIDSRASKSLSSDGTYIIDELNEMTNPRLNSFTGSEHRNVLYIMSRSNFQPGPGY
jgi:hypothetical protein